MLLKDTVFFYEIADHILIVRLGAFRCNQWRICGATVLIIKCEDAYLDGLPSLLEKEDFAIFSCENSLFKVHLLIHAATDNMRLVKWTRTLKLAILIFVPERNKVGVIW